MELLLEDLKEGNLSAFKEHYEHGSYNPTCEKERDILCWLITNSPSDVVCLPFLNYLLCDEKVDVEWNCGLRYRAFSRATSKHYYECEKLMAYSARYPFRESYCRLIPYIHVQIYRDDTENIQRLLNLFVHPYHGGKAFDEHQILKFVGEAISDGKINSIKFFFALGHYELHHCFTQTISKNENLYHLACLTGDIDVVEAIINGHDDFEKRHPIITTPWNDKNIDGDTPLLAMIKHMDDIVPGLNSKVLPKPPQPIWSTVEFQKTQEDAVFQMNEIVQCLIILGADINASDSRGFTLLRRFDHIRQINPVFSKLYEVKKFSRTIKSLGGK